MEANINLLEKIESTVDAVELFEKIRNEPYSVLLDSSMRDNKLGKYSILASNPFLIFKSKGSQIEITQNGITCHHRGHPLDFLRKLLKQYPCDANPYNLPFTSGCIGYLSYELCSLIENLPQSREEHTEDIPDIFFCFYNSAIIIDHTQHCLFISVSAAGMSDFSKKEPYLREQMQRLKNIVDESSSSYTGLKDIKTKGEAVLEKTKLPMSNFSKESYCEMVLKAKQYIRNGDIYQVNLSQQFKTKTYKNALDLFKKLRHFSPAPFSAFLNFESLQVLSSSPERFIRIKGHSIETRPIKGTRPRGKTTSEDNLLKEELLNSEKDRAELTMIVDLERNDLGKVCRIGTVEVEKLFELESYATVHHLVSTVKGELKEGKDVIDCIKATFPGGSITGAPKIRAMEIIHELEPVKRNIYTGSIGYIGFNGDTDLNIAIRTLIMKGEEVSYNVGGGIVWDSDPEKEYQETLHKGKAMLKVLSEE
ncbi:MAG: aminodeoxychorismate synthase component I [Clostridia bacterium]|nr:aminodeoxychorismate synthase component I [Clostridia bacterium]